MIGKGSPKIMMEIASKAQQSRSSPKLGGKRKRRSPKAKTSRANWNPGLEKGLVQILLDHDNDHYRAQNGWKTVGWNLMYQKFCEEFPYVGFSRDQVQDKEKELKREFNMLKDARQQSGVHWDEKLCMIVAEPAIWDNIIVSYPKASKFQRHGFPLFDDLYKLYAGKKAEGKHSFISLERTEDNDVRILEPSLEQHITGEGVGSLGFLSSYNQLDDDEDEEVREVTILHSSTLSREKESAAAASSFKDKRSAVERSEEPSASGVKGKKAEEKRKNACIAEMMGSYIELKAKQTQMDLVEQEKARDESASFSIKNCNAVLATIEELSGEERADAYEVFKDAQNREIFITAEPSSRLIWLRRKIGSMAAANPQVLQAL